MKKREQYAIGQHDLCCEHLGIGNSHEDHCDTLFEAVLSLKEKLDEWHDAAKHVDADYVDEVHCSCVPILRKQLQDARKEIEQLKAKQ
jgi:hypothetical protein